MVRDVDIGSPVNRDFPRLAVKTPSNVATGNLFTITGTVRIIDIVGRVTTAIQNQACTLRLGVVADALSEVFLCAASGSVASFAVGSMFSITGTAATGMSGTTSVGVILAQASPWVVTTTTSGSIHLTTSATNTGVIQWMVSWTPISQDGNIVAT
jgi:hypothetical protein